jgi:hypothetical protein
MKCHKGFGTHILWINGPKLKEKNMRRGTWNVRSLYRASSFVTSAKGILKYNLDLVGVQEVRWDRNGLEPAGEYTFFYAKGNEKHEVALQPFRWAPAAFSFS